MFSGSNASRSQRAQELRMFFAPFDPRCPPSNAPKGGFNSSIQDDGALASLAETAAWRLGAKRAIVSLVDRDTEYFIASATRGEVTTDQDGLWFGRSNEQMPGSLCESTLTLEVHSSECLCFIINDLSSDNRFRHLPFVDGSIAALRFYAGTPITTDRGVRIGSFSVYDDEPRPDGLSIQHEKFLCQSASRVMRYLEVQREAAERRRVALMSKGIAKFLEGMSSELDENGLYGEPKTVEQLSGKATAQSNGDPRYWGVSQRSSTDKCEADQPQPCQPLHPQVNTLVEDTFNRAAKILRESLEIHTGGVIFSDTAVGFSEAGITDAYTDSKTDPGAKFKDASSATGQTSQNHGDKHLPLQDGYQGQVRSSGDQSQAVGVLASSVANAATWDRVDGKFLQSLLNSYPRGRMWYYDEDGYFSSLEQLEQAIPIPAIGPSERQCSFVEDEISRKKIEAQTLLQKFQHARQIVFLPLWDAGAKRWYAGCFAWSHSSVPVFTVESEIAYLVAFTNSVMAEVSRLDAIRADQTKADFISSISRIPSQHSLIQAHGLMVSDEFRSPLHGILASAEFLREMTSEETQVELISTVQHCGRTLLDTINHILDFSKINSYEKTLSLGSQDRKGTLPNELHAVVNVAVLCEEVVDGMIAAKRFKDSNVEGSAMFAITEATPPGSPLAKESSDAIKVVLDFQHRDWNFVSQPGALRRIVMNVFGNAQKYTEKGFIRVILRAQDAGLQESADEDSVRNTTMSLIIQDSGRGMSSEYLQHKLYSPFAQEDTFASGVGLGLSIVRSIVQQLCGTVNVSSLLGKGTQVTICLPLQGDSPSNRAQLKQADSADHLSSFKQAETCLEILRKVTHGKSIGLHQREIAKRDRTSGENMVLDYIDLYLTQWYSLTVTKFSALSEAPELDLIIAVEDEQDDSFDWSDQSAIGKLPPVVLVTDRYLGQKGTRELPNGVFGYYTRPVGPYKFAKWLLACFEKLESSNIDPNSRHGCNNTKHSLDIDKKQDAAFDASHKQQGMSSSKENPAIGNGGLEEGQSSATQSSHPVRELYQDDPKGTGGARGDDDQVNSEEGTVPAYHPCQAKFRSTLSDQLESTDAIAIQQRPLRILVVEDNEINLQLLHRFLAKRKGDTINAARNGYEAVAAVQETTVPYDVMFMDISMPGMNGFEATRQIRRHEGEVRARARRESPSRPEFQVLPGPKQAAYIVALTGLGAGRDRDEAVECGFDEFLTKPIPFQKIGRMLNERSRYLERP